MKRSDINAIMCEADAFIQEKGFVLPPFAHWRPDEWRDKGPEVSEIVNNQLGWDITDFGSGDYEKTGLFLFTLRNGNPANWQTRQGKLYAEKVLIAKVGQVTPMHFHWIKMEDIINRGGGRLLIRLFNSTSDGSLDVSSPVRFSMDGVQYSAQAGNVVELKPGESICLTPGLYHSFWGEDEPVLVGEVSLVNDDSRDNRFWDAPGRFASIEEDQPPLYLLAQDYQRYYRPCR